MAALIKAPALKEGALDLFPPRATGTKSPAPKLPAAESVAAVAPVPVSRFPASERTASVASAPTPVPASKNAPDAAVGAGDDCREEAFRERLKAQEALLAESRNRAASEGYAAGLAEGRQAAAKEYAEAIDAWRRLLEPCRAGTSSLLQESEEIIAAVVFESVCKVVGRELVAPETCARVVKEVVSRVSRDEIVSVRISPSDYADLSAAATEGADRLLGITGVSIEPDERVELGGCVVNMKGGSIDGRIETQFRTFAQSLKDAARRK